MEAFFGLDTWGVDWILWIQSWSSGLLDGLFLAITRLGNFETYLVLLPLIYWCVDRRWGLRLLHLVLISAWLAEAVKILFALPRPDPKIVRQLVHETSYGFPSNHAQTGGIVVWGYSASRVRRPWFTALAVILAFLIGLSRSYLGVHFPQDVLGGWLIGLLVLGAGLRLEPILVSWWHRQRPNRRAVAVLILSLAMVFLMPAGKLGQYPAEVSTVFGGVLAGAGLGAILEERTVRFRVEGPLGQRLLRYLFGMALVAALYLLESLVPSMGSWPLEAAVLWGHFALIGLTTIWLVPWVLVRLGLASSERPA